VYEEIARIPFLVRWKGTAPAGSSSSGLVSHIDVVPTFLDYFGQTVPDLLQGRSLLSQFRLPASAVNDEVFIEFNRFEIDHDGFGAFAPIRCIRRGDYKLAVNLLDTDELYDLAADPGEMNNLIAAPEFARVRDELHAALMKWMDRTRDPLRGPHWRRRPWATQPAPSTWGGPTRPRPFDENYYPKSLLYDTAETISRYEYPKG
jgi:uncharacterized sulfatase